MTGENNLKKLIKSMEPRLNEGEFVFCAVVDPEESIWRKALMLFREAEAMTFILRKEDADDLGLDYSFVASWITLTIHSSLDAVGLTAAFSAALAEEHISCNVVAGFYHDHIFVNSKDSEKALIVLKRLSEKG